MDALEETRILIVTRFAALTLSASYLLSGCVHGAYAPENSLARLYANHVSNQEVEAGGTVSKVLGTRLTRSGDHEGFIVDVPLEGSSRTVRIKVEDNVDVTGPIPVSPGDRVRFRGEYVYDSRGGIVHWTHHDPRMRHEPGFIDVNGKRYS